MTLRDNAIDVTVRECQWVNLEEALRHFATYTGSTQSQQHIKPLHWYVASRLVIEGGFSPDDITPRPPLAVECRNRRRLLRFDPNKATGGERTVLGGLKTKNVDVVVTKDGIGPVLAVSCKGMTGAFRNLTNRMEETIGECTNLHITYPALVFGYMFVLKANRIVEAAASIAESSDKQAGRQLLANDIAIRAGGEPVETIFRFHSALRELTGRRGIRDDVSGYEAVALALIEPEGNTAGTVLSSFPPLDSPLRLEQFFQNLYLRYDERYVFGAPDLSPATRRLEWDEESPVFQNQIDAPHLDYVPRLASGERQQ